jgi:hypothetical protein
VTQLAGAFAPYQRVKSVCADGKVYWAEQSQTDPQYKLFETPIAGGEPVELVRGNNLNYSTVFVRPQEHRLWFQQLTALWVMPQGGGTAVKITEDVKGYPQLLSPSPDGKKLLYLAASGLYAIDPNGTVPTRLATGVDQFAWVSATQVVFTVTTPAAPLRFLGGVYLATVP